MGLGIKSKQINTNINNYFGYTFLNASLLVLISIILNVYIISSSAEGKQQSDYEPKKKVVIVGEMSDMFANESIRSSEPELHHNYDYDYNYADELNHNRIRRYKPIHPTEITPIPGQQYVRRKKPGSMFVPVAAYSITKSKTKPKPSRTSANRYRKRQGGPVRRNPDLGGKQTESAVYGYMQRPEIIEFRGQYFYGPRPGDPLDTPLTPAGSSMEGIKYPPYDPIDPHTSAANPYASYYNGGKLKGTGGLGPGGLLLATLPLILAPMLSYLFTPMIIPITATVAAGKRRRRDTELDDSLQVMMSDSNMDSLDRKVLKDASFATKSSSKSSHTSSPYKPNEWLDSDRLNDPKYKEAQVVVEYLRKVQFDERATTRAVANYLQCDGMLADGDHCIERLSCEFSDPHNSGAPELDRAVTSIILGHILNNEYITDSFKIKLKLAAIHGKDNPGKCSQKFNCNKVENNSTHNKQ